MNRPTGNQISAIFVGTGRVPGLQSTGNRGCLAPRGIVDSLEMFAARANTRSFGWQNTPVTTCQYGTTRNPASLRATDAPGVERTIDSRRDRLIRANDYDSQTLMRHPLTFDWSLEIELVAFELNRRNFFAIDPAGRSKYSTKPFDWQRYRTAWQWDTITLFNCSIRCKSCQAVT